MCTLIYSMIHAQINPDLIDIVRDSYGVPHIFAATDAEVSYGLAWAHAEDDFTTIQQGYLAGNNMLSINIGNAGLGADFIAQFIGSEELFNDRYVNEISAEYKKVVDGYAAGLNSYATSHPEEVLVKALFPITPKKINIIEIILAKLIFSSKKKIPINMTNTMLLSLKALTIGMGALVNPQITTP